MKKFSQYVMEMETPGATTGTAGQAPAPGAGNPVQILMGLAKTNPQVQQALAALTPEMLQQLKQPQQPQVQPVQQAQQAQQGQVQQAGTQQVGR